LNFDVIIHESEDFTKDEFSSFGPIYSLHSVKSVVGRVLAPSAEVGGLNPGGVN